MGQKSKKKAQKKKQASGGGSGPSTGGAAGALDGSMNLSATGVSAAAVDASEHKNLVLVFCEQKALGRDVLRQHGQQQGSVGTAVAEHRGVLSCRAPWAEAGVANMHAGPMDVEHDEDGGVSMTLVSRPACVVLAAWAMP